jgi:glycosyltransferase involved in cell wall biosynthesis
MLLISVIVCAHNPREEFLRRVLEGLRQQSLSQEQWELLLIDNASQAPLSGRFDISWHPLGQHVREDETGLTPARLRGIRESKGEIIIMVDDDTVLAPDYLEQALIVSEQWPFIGAWCGSLFPEFEILPPNWIGDQAWRLSVVEVKADVWSNLRDNFTTLPYGAGMCIRSQVGRKYLEWCLISQKSSALDRTGKSLGGYGDLDLGYCALDLGFGTGKSTRLKLTHLIPATRLTLDYFLRHAEGDAISLQIFRAVRSLPVQKPAPTDLIDSFRWFIHRLVHRVPREQYKIAKAHHRGMVKGWELAQKLIKPNSTGQKSNP